jgi:hypothetical protein
MKNITVILAFLFLALPVFSQDNQPKALVREVYGEVEVKRPGDAAWVTARPNMALSGNTLISTGFRSTARIALGNSILTVRPLSRLSLEELSADRDTEKTALFLQAGRVRADVNPPANERKTNFQVRTPSATASVRGTSFDIDPMNLKVNAGIVAFAGKDGVSRMIPRGKSSSIDASGQTLSYTAAENRDLQIPAQRPRTGATSTGTIDVELGWYGADKE